MVLDCVSENIKCLSCLFIKKDMQSGFSNILPYWSLTSLPRSLKKIRRSISRQIMGTYSTVHYIPEVIVIICM